MVAFGWPAHLQHVDVFRYTFTFANEQMPPVNGFESLTMYMIDPGCWFVPNPLNKFT